ncbi:hypothetical protein LZ31DRAFT_283325 [Colletotrichum somersetense]|nr:hypothetical protein LZ31DRAFT_283325 [Colletotrichum somersetense]
MVAPHGAAASCIDKYLHTYTNATNKQLLGRLFSGRRAKCFRLSPHIRSMEEAESPFKSFCFEEKRFRVRPTASCKTTTCPRQRRQPPSRQPPPPPYRGGRPQENTPCFDHHRLNRAKLVFLNTNVTELQRVEGAPQVLRLHPILRYSRMAWSESASPIHFFITRPLNCVRFSARCRRKF